MENPKPAYPWSKYVTKKYLLAVPKDNFTFFTQVIIS